MQIHVIPTFKQSSKYITIWNPYLWLHPFPVQLDWELTHLSENVALSSWQQRRLCSRPSSIYQQTCPLSLPDMFTLLCLPVLVSHTSWNGSLFPLLKQPFVSCCTHCTESALSILMRLDLSCPFLNLGLDDFLFVLSKTSRTWTKPASLLKHTCYYMWLKCPVS